MEGELRSTREIKTKNNKIIELLNVLVDFGKFEKIEQVANFSKATFQPGPIRLKVVPSAAASGERVFINWKTFEA
jgi:hypothetical protein